MYSFSVHTHSMLHTYDVQLFQTIRPAVYNDDASP